MKSSSPYKQSRRNDPRAKEVVLGSSVTAQTLTHMYNDMNINSSVGSSRIHTFGDNRRDVVTPSLSDKLNMEAENFGETFVDDPQANVVSSVHRYVHVHSFFCVKTRKLHRKCLTSLTVCLPSLM